MTDNDKIYYPEVIETYALPETVAPTDNASGGSSGGQTNLTPSTNVDKSFPEKDVARETIGSALNTKTKKILGDFSFGQVGAISIGVYENGVSGDIRITPNGITARNINGTTTFSIDGSDGSAVFLGTITAGAIISGAVVVGDSTIILDGANKRIVVNDGSDDRIVIGSI